MVLEPGAVHIDVCMQVLRPYQVQLGLNLQSPFEMICLNSDAHVHVHNVGVEGSYFLRRKLGPTTLLYCFHEDGSWRAETRAVFPKCHHHHHHHQNIFIFRK